MAFLFRLHSIYLQFKQELAKQFINIMMYTELQLTSFGNYLLERYGVMVHSTDGNNQPLHQREVHHADVCNWQDKEGIVPDTNYLPSRFQIGDLVKIHYGESLHLNDCRILRVHFTQSKVSYDVDANITYILDEPQDDRGRLKTISKIKRLYNIDSALVLPKE